MNRRIISGISVFLFVMFSHHAFAQLKYEKESRLDEKEVPAPALDFVQALMVEGNIKWYLEEGLNRNSIEAKFSLKDQKYSVEFDTIGNLEDIEVRMEWDELNSSLQDSIIRVLGKDCEKYKPQRIQIQFSGDPAVLLNKIKTGESTETFTTRYEIVVKCRQQSNVDLFEYLFSEEGQKLSVSQILLKNSSHLEY